MPRPASWTHDRERFYKYTTASTAKAILANRKLRWSSPALFNDPFDVQFDPHLEFDRERVIQNAMNELWERYSGKKPIVMGNPLAVALRLLMHHAPGIPRAELERDLLPGLAEALDRGESTLPEVHAQAREVLAAIKLLCFSEVFDNILMWAHYSEAHAGAVLRFSCIEALDSAWGAAHPIRYQARMPRLLDEKQSTELLIGQVDINELDLFASSVLTKAADWAYEKEWRIIGGFNPKVPYEDIPFHPTELTGLYLGCRIKPEDRDELLALVRADYPHASVYIGHKSDRTFSLEFAELTDFGEGDARP